MDCEIIMRTIGPYCREVLIVFGPIASMKSLAIRREQLAILEFIRFFNYICFTVTGQEEQQKSIS